MKHKVTTLVASAAIAFAPISPLLAQTDAVNATASVAEVWVPASQAEQEAARGGGKWIVTAGKVIKYCSGSGRGFLTCMQDAVFAAQSVTAVRAFTCKKWRKFC